MPQPWEKYSNPTFRKKKVNKLQQPLVIINMTQQVDKRGEKIYHFRLTTSKRSSKENSIITY
jgi:hypothetical protein